VDRRAGGSVELADVGVAVEARHHEGGIAEGVAPLQGSAPAGCGGVVKGTSPHLDGVESGEIIRSTRASADTIHEMKRIPIENATQT
jgi:hypothetical protein